MIFISKRLEFILSILFFFTCFQSVISENYIWIGGDGNWSDPQHWFSESGGIPTSTDNVIFNSGSFNAKYQIVTLDIPAICRDMNWSAVTYECTLTGAQNLEIKGSLILSPLLAVNLSGNITFTASTNNNLIRSEGMIINSDMIFDGTGSWVLQDNLNNSLKIIYLNKGTLNLNGQSLTCGSFYSNSDELRALNMIAGTVNIVGLNGSWNVNNQLNIIGEGSTIKMVNDSFLSVNTFIGSNLDYCDVVLMNDANISGNNSFIDLYLNAGHNYWLPSSGTQTINGNLLARGCSGMISINASGGSQACISKFNGDINIYFVKLRSIKGILGGNDFNAFNSIDDGNNEGINIYSNTRDMVWVDGSGLWSDTAHWTSDPFNNESDCVPILYDNVSFNDASFFGNDTVKVDYKEIGCHDMKWTGSKNPTFLGLIPNPVLSIYGSLEFSPYMKNKFMGSVTFADTVGGNYIKTSDVGFNKEIVLNGENGSWILYDSLKVEGAITHFYGGFSTNDNFIRCHFYRSDSAFSRLLDLGASEFLITTTGYPNAWSVNSENLEFNGGTSLIEMKAVNAAMYNYGGDTLDFNNILFSATTGAGKLNSFSGTHCTFHKAEFESNGTIISNNVFDTLSFSPGSYYELSSGSTQTINNAIYPTGTCNGPILLKSVENGSKASIFKSADTLWVENTAIRDINAIGGAVFFADHGVDLGNNTGWDTISLSAPGKLYWIGGAGDWNDQSHWSLSSGGPGGECVPTPYDTVIFDQHSFGATDQFTNVNLNNAFAHNMDWTYAQYIPEFKSSNSLAYLRIYGSLKLNPDMEFTFPGFISFESSDTNETVITENIKFHNVNNNVYFDGIGGEWTLMDSLQLGYSITNRNYIYYCNGDLNTNSQYVDCFGFSSTIGSPRNLKFDNSDLHVLYEYNVNGLNLNLQENSSLIEIDSGNFIHQNGSYFPYNLLYFNAVNNLQSLITNSADSVMFTHVAFNSKEGKMNGNYGSLYSHLTEFKGIGQINQNSGSNVNVYVIDTLLFSSIGTIFGNDTVRNYVYFDSTGNITGNGEYKNAYFNDDGNIVGNNLFDTLTFNPPYTYQLGSQNTQTITDQFNIIGNNCEFIKLKATSESQAEVFKETGSVYGNFIEMTRITATGGAFFDAGQFSKDIDNSNIGWLFHDASLNYSLGPDTSILEGETINICTENFNGNQNTSYEWRNCLTGEILSNDSCLLVGERGYYCLTVFYDEGSGCIKYDTIFIGCYLDLEIDTSHVTCNGFSDGAVEIDIQIGIGPFDINWYSNGNIIGNNQNIYNLIAGDYYFTIEDSQGCISGDSVEVKEPFPLEMDYEWKDACNGYNNCEIILQVDGGTEPYNYNWSNGSNLPQLTGLPPGTYNVVVSDANECPPLYESIVVSELPAISFDLEGTDLLCYQDGSGKIELKNLLGGTGNYISFEWLKDGQFFSDSVFIGSLQEGNYTVTVMDDFGCFSSNTVAIDQPTPLVLELSGINGITELGSIDLTASGGTLPYSFLWNTGAQTEDIDPLGGGLYYVDVTDGNSCKASDSVFVDVHFRIYAPTAFSPNNDGLNDQFELFGLGTDMKEFLLTIFNRYGQTVFQSAYPEIHWNGRVNNSGQELPVEVYTWIVELTYYGGAQIVDKGNVTLLR